MEALNTKTWLVSIGYFVTISLVWLACCYWYCQFQPWWVSVSTVLTPIGTYLLVPLFAFSGGMAGFMINRERLDGSPPPTGAHGEETDAVELTVIDCSVQIADLPLSSLKTDCGNRNLPSAASHEEWFQCAWQNRDDALNEAVRLSGHLFERLAIRQSNIVKPDSRQFILVGKGNDSVLLQMLASGLAPSDGKPLPECIVLAGVLELEDPFHNYYWPWAAALMLHQNSPVRTGVRLRINHGDSCLKRMNHTEAIDDRETIFWNQAAEEPGLQFWKDDAVAKRLTKGRPIEAILGNPCPLPSSLLCALFISFGHARYMADAGAQTVGISLDSSAPWTIELS